MCQCICCGQKDRCRSYRRTQWFSWQKTHAGCETKLASDSGLTGIIGPCTSSSKSEYGGLAYSSLCSPSCMPGGAVWRQLKIPTAQFLLHQRNHLPDGVRSWMLGRFWLPCVLAPQHVALWGPELQDACELLCRNSSVRCCLASHNCIWLQPTTS